MELTSFKPHSLPLIQNIQIESKCIRCRDPKGGWPWWVPDLQCGFTALPTSKLPRGSQAQAACTFTLSSFSSHWMRQLRQPSSPQLPQFLQRGMIDDDNNAACLAPWWRALCELMEACRLCTWGRLRGCPGTPTKLGCPSLWGWCEGRLEDIGLGERETRLWGIPTMMWDLPCPLALCVEGHPCLLLLEQHEASAGAGSGLGLCWVSQPARLHVKVPAVSAELSGHVESQRSAEQSSRVRGTSWPPV